MNYQTTEVFRRENIAPPAQIMVPPVATGPTLVNVPAPTLIVPQNVPVNIPAPLVVQQNVTAVRPVPGTDPLSNPVINSPLNDVAEYLMAPWDVHQSSLQNVAYKNVYNTTQHIQQAVVSLEDHIANTKHDSDEFIRVEWGSCLIRIGNREVILNEGQALTISKGVLHSIYNLSKPNKCKLSVIYSPPLFKKGNLYQKCEM